MKLIDGAVAVVKIVKEVMSFVGQQSQGGGSGPSSPEASGKPASQYPSPTVAADA
jgi:hypothetical protein